MEQKSNIELYNHAVEMCKEAWKRPSRKKYEKSLGFLLQANFGKNVWTLKDLDDSQILIIMGKADKKIKAKNG